MMFNFCYIYIYNALLRLFFKAKKSYITKGSKKILTAYKVGNNSILEEV